MFYVTFCGHFIFKALLFCLGLPDAGLFSDRVSGLYGVQSFSKLLPTFLGVFHPSTAWDEPRTCVGSYTDREGSLYPLPPSWDFLYVLWLPGAPLSGPLVRNMTFSQSFIHQHWACLRAKQQEKREKKRRFEGFPHCPHSVNPFPCSLV